MPEARPRWRKMCIRDRYYSDAERQAQAERERAEHAQTRNVFALLEGTWISEDGDVYKRQLSVPLSC